MKLRITGIKGGKRYITEALRDDGQAAAVSLADEVRSLMSAGRRDDAIGLVCRRTGMLEAEARRFTEALEPQR